MSIKGRECKLIITLISRSQARIGLEFLFQGPSVKCSGCEYRKVCIGSIKPGRIYRIVNMRNKILHCPLTDADMQVVEVAAAERPAAILAKYAIRSAIIEFKRPDCTGIMCENHELCNPVGLSDGDRCEIISVMESLHCPSGLALKKALLLPSPPL
ncbi:MAG: UPF0179 family protein [Nitrososphaerota archaeon]|nr:UPF0179 family protein [Candidatus Bathyarchaeota archaeon]MDW8048672.1 UPF0179 family protein [Nitrososphaerota archaeon]